MGENNILATILAGGKSRRFGTDKSLAKFYRDLMISEAGHYTLFLKYARKYSGEYDVDQRWQEWLSYEASVIKSYGKEETMHG